MGATALAAVVTDPDTGDSTGADAIYELDEGRIEDSPGTVRVRETESITEAIVRAVSAETGTDVLELPPLYYEVDSEATDDLFTASNGWTRQTDRTVRLEYCGRTVRVQGDGTVHGSATR